MPGIKSILFVCTGNSCRSVMAEGLLKKYLKEAGMSDIKVLSAGVRALEGFSPTEETVKVMREEGVDISERRSIRLTNDMIKSAGLILVMEEAHKEEIIRRVPDSAAKVFLLKEYGLKDKDRTQKMSVADPIGLPFEYYEASVSEIKKEIERIVKLL